METPNLHAVLIASPGLGHLTPVLQLGSRLVTHHSLSVTVFIVTTPDYHPDPDPPTKNLNIIHLPPVDISNQVDPDATIITRLYTIMRNAKPTIKAVLANISPHADMIITDLFGTESFTIAKELNIPKYVFVTTNAWFTALSMYCHVLDKNIEGQYFDQTEPLEIPGCKSVRPEELVEPMQDRNNQHYKEYVRMGIEFSYSDGILLNTWEDLERQTLDALRHNETLQAISKVPIYTIGPLTKKIEQVDQWNEIIEWLDKQPSKSVIYISFGSGGVLSAQQTNELAQGLELSQQRFVWVVRPPNDSKVDEVFLTSSNTGGTLHFLPNGFLSRTKDFGVLVPNLAPQMRILSHPAVGGFLSHSGWNSISESLTNGVPMIVWPLYAEQHMNATMLVEELGVAIRPAIHPTKGVVEKEEIAIMIRSLMEGKVAREKAMELKISSERALEKGGSSYNLMCQLIKDCGCTHVNAGVASIL